MVNTSSLGGGFKKKKKKKRKKFYHSGSWELEGREVKLERRKEGRKEKEASSQLADFLILCKSSNSSNILYEKGRSKEEVTL